MNHREGFADVAGLTIHYVEAGDGPPVVLLHGFPEFWFSWRKQIPALAAGGFHAIAPDLPGYNDSSKPTGIDAYAIPQIVRVVAEWIRRIAAPKCALVGHDWGGFIAWFVAMVEPELVDRLVILNAPHPVAYRRELAHLDQKLRAAYQLFFRPPWLPEFLMRRFRFLLLRMALSRNGHFTSEEIDRYVQSWRKPGALHAMANYYRAVGRTRGVRDLVRPITAPVLMIWGERDPFFSRAATERYGEWVPDLRMERIEAAGHFVQTDAPDRVNELLLGFLR